MVRSARRLAGAILVAASLADALAAQEDHSSALCEQAIVAGARRGGVPVEVLHAIALTETGRRTGDRLRPWPWAINREGEGFWFENRDQALAFARESIATGRPSFDVGCVQINYRWHGHAFPSIDAMLDPEWTATYAAQFLRTLYEQRGSWSEAAGAYHSLTPDYAMPYRERFDRILANLAPLEIDPSFAGLPPARRSTRAEQREAFRRAAVERLAAEPSAPPTPGSLAGGAFAPAASSLLTQGSPILGAARAGILE